MREQRPKILTIPNHFRRKERWAACMAHARRKFFDVFEATKSPLAKAASQAFNSANNAALRSVRTRNRSSGGLPGYPSRSDIARRSYPMR
jgi:hypothetical protein